jgi:hypothetical protein
MKDGYYHPEGAYCPTPVLHGFPGHGLANGPHYTDGQIKEFERKENNKEEMDCLVMAMNESDSNQDKLEELS